MNTHDQVVLVHGLWYGPWSMRLLAKRLHRAGHQVRLFSYPTTSADLATQAERLAQFALEGAPATCHFVAHSLGGLVVLAMLHGRTGFPAGRVVLLGSPLQGSRVARTMLQRRIGPWMLGMAATALSQGFATVPPGVEVGLVAGTRRIGLGHIAGHASFPGDGVVALEEADAPGLRARLVLPVSHTGMLFSRKVSREVATFLAEGHFRGEVARS